MRLALDVPGEPAACASAAADLHALGDTAGAAADALAEQARVSEAGFGGLSGGAYRQHVRRLVEPADDLARRSHRLAEALLELAKDLRDVRRAMALARRVARPLLVVTDHEIHSPAYAGDGPAARDAARAWDEAVRIVDAARQLEARAQQDWRDALDRFALGTGGLSPYQPLLQEHLPPLAPLSPTGGTTGEPHPGPTAPPEVSDPVPAAGPPSVPGPGGSPAATTTPASTPGAPATTPAAAPVAHHGYAAEPAGHWGAAPVTGPVTGPDAPAGVPAAPPTCAGVPTGLPGQREGTWAAAELDDH